MFSAIKPFIKLCRISNIPTVWTNVLAATVLAGRGFSLPVFLMLSLSMSLFYSAGMCLNDIFDFEEDKIKKPFRPLPSGSVSMGNARIVTISMFLTALSLLLFVPYQKALTAGLLLLAFIIVYDRFHKAHPLSVVLMAACRLMVFAVSSIAVSGEIGLYVAVAGLTQFFYTLIISLAARYENSRERGYSFPVIPLMISCISLLDGIILAVLASPAWIIAGIGGTLLTGFGQRYVRGD
jgi:4-hydroxybenzoate polyprenyltransferase